MKLKLNITYVSQSSGIEISTDIQKIATKPVESELRHLIYFQHFFPGGWKLFGNLSVTFDGKSKVDAL